MVKWVPRAIINPFPSIQSRSYSSRSCCNPLLPGHAACTLSLRPTRMLGCLSTASPQAVSLSLYQWRELLCPRCSTSVHVLVEFHEVLVSPFLPVVHVCLRAAPPLSLLTAPPSWYYKQKSIPSKWLHHTIHRIWLCSYTFNLQNIVSLQNHTWYRQLTWQTAFWKSQTKANISLDLPHGFVITVILWLFNQNNWYKGPCATHTNKWIGFCLLHEVTTFSS